MPHALLEAAFGEERPTMNEEILKRYADLWDDEGWCLLRAENVPGGFVPFHIDHSTMKVIATAAGHVT